MPLYLGVDVSAASLDVAYAYQGQEALLSSYPNRPTGWRALDKAVVVRTAAAADETIHLIVEPTGGYERGLVRYAHEQGWAVSVVNPFYLRRFSQGQGQRGKSDSRDALMLARYGAQQEPPAQWQMAADAQALQSLVSRRDDIKKLLRAEHNRRLQAQHDPSTPQAVLDSLARTLETLSAELDALEEAIADLLQRSATLHDQEQLLRSIPGVGRKVVLRLLALCHRFEALTAGEGTANQLVAFLGLDPQPHESGRSVHKRTTISRMGDRAGRADLFMAALGGVRGHNPLRTFYQRLLDNGKAKKLALVACSRKILVWAWAVFSSHQPFDPLKASPPS